MQHCIIVDIDGTLAEIGHRMHHITPPDDFDPRLDTFKPDWDSFNQACALDGVYEDIKQLVDDIYETGTTVYLVTGRDASVRSKTENWLKSKGIEYHDLFMRPEGDRRADLEVKREIYEQQIKGHFKVEFVLEDRSRVVNMWRELGLTCLQVKEGDY